MSIAQLPSPDLFSTEPLRGLPSDANVDRKTRTITGAKAMQLGPLSAGDSRPWKVDRTTLEQLTSLVNRRNNGAKMRFAHPNMSRDGMGRHLGRATTARIVESGEDTYVAVDAKLSESATRSPSGNLTDHVLDLATESPEDFGLSIAPVIDREAMNKIEPDANGLIPIRMKDLRAIDFVDEPAATRGGLFDLRSDSLADLPAQATDLLDTFFADSSADVIRSRFGEFLNTYIKTRGDDMSSATPAPIETTPVVAPVVEAKPTLSSEDLAKQSAKVELTRRSEITALCTLAKVPDVDRDLMLSAGFSRAEAQDWLKSSGKLSASNPPISEGGGSPAEQSKKSPDEKFGAEYDANDDIYIRQGLSRFDYINSRRIDEKLPPHAKPKVS